MGGKLLSAIKSFYEEASACVKISGETSEHFEIKVGLRQGCVMSPWLFNIHMDGVMREVTGDSCGSGGNGASDCGCENGNVGSGCGTHK